MNYFADNYCLHCKNPKQFTPVQCKVVLFIEMVLRKVKNEEEEIPMYLLSLLRMECDACKKKIPGIKKDFRDEQLGSVKN